MSEIKYISIPKFEPNKKLQKGDQVKLRVYGETRKWKWGIDSKTLGCFQYLIQFDSALDRMHIVQQRRL